MYSAPTDHKGDNRLRGVDNQYPVRLAWISSNDDDKDRILSSTDALALRPRPCLLACLLAGPSLGLPLACWTPRLPGPNERRVASRASRVGLPHQPLVWLSWRLRLPARLPACKLCCWSSPPPPSADHCRPGPARHIHASQHARLFNYDGVSIMRPFRALSRTEVVHTRPCAVRVKSPI